MGIVPYVRCKKCSGKWIIIPGESEAEEAEYKHEDNGCGFREMNPLIGKDIVIINTALEK